MVVKGENGKSKRLELPNLDRIVVLTVIGSRWWKLRKAVAGQLLTNNFRMQLVRRRFSKVRKGTIRLQGTYRGHAFRRVLAAIKVQKVARMTRRRFIFRRIRSAVLALQCKQRVRMATSIYEELRREQKDIGKLKQNNEKLKSEMASLKAMLAAQAQAGASSAEFEKQMKQKEDEIAGLEKRISDLESDLAKEQAMLKTMEEKMQKQKDKFGVEKELMEKLHKGQLNEMQKQIRKAPIPASTKHTSRKQADVGMATLPSNYVSPEILAKHEANVARLEEELEAERKLRREADAEIIKLRATISGVQLQESDVQDLLAQQLESAPPQARKLPSTIGEEDEEEDEDEVKTSR